MTTHPLLYAFRMRRRPAYPGTYVCPTCWRLWSGSYREHLRMIGHHRHRGFWKAVAA